MRRARTKQGEGEEHEPQHGKYRRQLPHPAAQGPQDLAELLEQLKHHEGLEDPKEPEDAKRPAIAGVARRDDVVHDREEEDGQIDLVEPRRAEPRGIPATEAQGGATDEDLEEHDGEEEGVEGCESRGALRVGGPSVEEVAVELGLQGDGDAVGKGGQGACGGPARVKVQLGALGPKEPHRRGFGAAVRKA